MRLVGPLEYKSSEESLHVRKEETKTVPLKAIQGTHLHDSPLSPLHSTYLIQSLSNMSDLWKPAPEPESELGRYRILSPTAGIRVSPLQLGAMSIGDSWSSFMGSMDKKASFKLLDAFSEAGSNFIDTACNYQDEQSETWIGEWMAARKNRDQMVISTKYTTDYKS